MKKVKIGFIGFWNGFDEKRNFIYQILSERYDVELSDKPEYAFIYPLGNPCKYTKYDGVRILVAGEPVAPDFSAYDYAIGFDHIDFGERYIRYPVSIWSRFGPMKYRTSMTEEEAEAILKNKSVFCNFVYSHESQLGMREKLFDALNEYKHVDAAGTYRNNQLNGYYVKGATKHQLLDKSKFTIAAESMAYPGFCTEKIAHAFLRASIPIYAGDPLVAEEFNTKAFVNCADYCSVADVVERVKELDQNDKLYKAMLMEPVMVDPAYCQMQYEKLKAFLYNIFDQEKEDAIRRGRYFTFANVEKAAKEYYKVSETLPFKMLRKLKII